MDPEVGHDEVGGCSHSDNDRLDLMRPSARWRRTRVPTTDEPDKLLSRFRDKRGAGDGVRTRDIQLGKLALYQLSYTRTVGLKADNDHKGYHSMERTSMFARALWLCQV